MKQYVEFDLRALRACMPDVQACMHAVRCVLYIYIYIYIYILISYIIIKTRIATNILYVTVPGLNFRADFIIYIYIYTFYKYIHRYVYIYIYSIYERRKTNESYMCDRGVCLRTRLNVFLNTLCDHTYIIKLFNCHAV